VTEAEWLAATNPHAMLAFLSQSSRTSERKLRLALCAACRGLWKYLYDHRSREAVELAELFADGLASGEELLAAKRAARAAARERPDPPGPRAHAVVCVTAADIRWSASRPLQLPDKRIGQVLHDIFGNPWRPPARVEPSWLAREGGVVPRLAGAIYGDREFDRLPLLADALEDAGCADAALLGHLRGPGPHWRGCWALDLLIENAEERKAAAKRRGRNYCGCLYDGCPIPLVAEVANGAEGVRFYWCSDCRKLFAAVGDSGRELIVFAVTGRGEWQMLSSRGTAEEVRAAANAVVRVRPDFKAWNRLGVRLRTRVYSGEL
jgi:hypothetical protein